ncbi:MAG: hypothetical protein KKC76_03355 [Proteobacteria bacterium]|nr:hypothetical protein [Pseudomonadota bacterium]MBU4295745.1 hypothetical protein [Pseudomonadota bacterium]MCG2747164.1 DUF6447 family protein [Desulfobulbaceae bacterium]
MEKQGTITINNKEYIIENLDDNAKAQLLSIQMCDQEIARHKAQMAIAETAKMAYSRALIEAVESEH